jgi:membrane associated rhomboid family serine protease
LLAIGATLYWWKNPDTTWFFFDVTAWHGEPWRLITSIFPHVGFWHLVFNVYWLWVFGCLVENVYGSLRFLAVLLLFAIGSTAAEYAVGQIGVGLSGVGYGLFGMVCVLSQKDERFRGAVDLQTIVLFCAWFFFCIFLTWAEILPVGNIAHGVGACRAFSSVLPPLPVENACFFRPCP